MNGSESVVPCGICGAEIHLEYGKYMTRWINGKQTRVCRMCDRPEKWRAKGEERPPEEIGEKQIVGAGDEMVRGVAVEAPEDEDEAVKIEIGKEKDMAKDAITKKCKGCGEEGEVVNENAGGVDEDLIERIIERMLKARLKALLG